MRTPLLLLILLAPAWAAEPAPALAVKPWDTTIAKHTQERLPTWIRLSGEFRTRVEGRTGFSFQPGNDDAYGLFRVRVNVSLVPASWFEAYFQGQDARVAGIESGRPLGIFKNPADIRQAYLRFGRADGPVKLTVGRQLLNYGAQRILGPLDWTNNSRTWDAVKLELSRPGAKLDVFASSVVENDPGRRIDLSRRGYNIHGAYGSLSRVLPHSVVEPYLLYRTGGQSGLASAGLRVASSPGQAALHGYDYQVEGVHQSGRYAGLVHRAWAFSVLGGKTMTSRRWSPRVSAEYSGASGDGDASDGTHRTFDHLLGTNHLFYGLVDAVGWQNMRNVRLGFDAKPRKGLQFSADYHWLWVATARDSLYDVAGRATVRPRVGQSARAIGTELDFTLGWSITQQWKAGGGIGRLFAGEFLQRNAGGASQLFPFVFAQYSF